MVNEVTLIGNTGADPEVFIFENGDKNVRVSLATSLNWKDKEGNKKEKTTWHYVQFNGPLAEIVEKYVKKGDRLYINGRIDNYEYQDKEGQIRYATRVICNRFNMLSNKATEKPAITPIDGGSAPASAPASAPGSSEDDDLPF